MKALVTGGAGFIGRHLVSWLLNALYDVSVFDNVVNVSELYAGSPPLGGSYRLVQGDLLDIESLTREMDGIDVVFHMAANSDIALGASQTNLDLKQGTIASYNVLEAMRRSGVRNVVFASTSAVYGDALYAPTREDYGPLFPISLYGAGKLAVEGMISAFVHNYGFQAWIYRLANVVGQGANHGVIVDFIRKLKQNSHFLEILGDGKQAKPYLYISDCIRGMMWGYEHGSEPVNYFNLTSTGVTSVDRVASIVIEAMGLGEVRFIYSGDKRGWPGDVCQVCLDDSKLAAMGWKARLTSDQAVRKATQEALEGYCETSGYLVRR